MSGQRAIERLWDELEHTRLFIRLYRQRWDDMANSPGMQHKIEEVIERAEEHEKNLERAIIGLEDCAHEESEDTGGPDGSQVCLECGKTWP